MAPSDAQLAELVQRVTSGLAARGMRVAVAESCTGGWIAKLLTDLPGSSTWFGYGFVTYSDEAKHQLLGVSTETLALHGAVSTEVAEQMATGARLASAAEVAVAVSGIAGPGGGRPGKPVGTVCLAWAGPGAALASTVARFGGNRDAVRRSSAASALEGILLRLAVP